MYLFKAYLEAWGREKKNELYPQLLRVYTDICKEFSNSISLFEHPLKLLKIASEQIPCDNSQWKQTAVLVFGYNLGEKHAKMEKARAKWKAVCEKKKKNNPS